MGYKAYVGTYTANSSKGIYSFLYDKENIKAPTLFTEISNPKYLCFVEDYIAAVVDFSKGAGVAIYDMNAKLITSLIYEYASSCYICYEDGYIYTANYHEGTISILEFKNEKLSLVKKIKIKDKAGAHQVLLSKDKIFVPCLFLDELVIIDKKSLQREKGIKFELGAGPRHGVFFDDGKYLYVVGELSNRLYTCDVAKKELVASVDLLENGESFIKDSAAIRKRGDFLYISTRTKDVLSVMKLENGLPKLIQVKTCFGKHPRDFIIQDNKLIVANRFSNKISLIQIKEDGTLGEELSSIEVPEAVSIILKENNNE